MEAALQSKLGHFLSIVAAEVNGNEGINIGVFEILPLRFPLPLELPPASESFETPLESLEYKTLLDNPSATDLSDIHHYLWKWEKSLIAVCRDLSLNSSYGGNSFAIRTLSKEIEDILTGSKELVAKAHAFRTAARHPSSTVEGE